MNRIVLLTQIATFLEIKESADIITEICIQAQVCTSPLVRIRVLTAHVTILILQVSHIGEENIVVK